MPSFRGRSATAFRAALAMLAIVVLPAALTLHTVRSSDLRLDIPTDATPYGYTVSLLLFLVPSAAIAFLFLPLEGVRLSRRAFFWTIGLLFPIGAALDFFFAHLFFRFPNRIATLGWLAPALGGGVPVEEYVFYLSGFITVVLLYIWFDEYWLAAYNIPATDDRRITFQRLLHFHPASLLIAVLLVVGGVFYHYFVARIAGGFPGYFLFLVLTAMVPSTVLFPAARPVVNWRALSLTMFVVVLISLLWEATVAVPYNWWNFQDEQMIGVRITAWARLPIEEVYLWIAVTYSSVLVYEVVKRWKASRRTMQHALFGNGGSEEAQLPE